MAAETGRRSNPVKLDVTRTVSDGGDPELVLVTQGRADNVSFVLFEVCHSLNILVRPGSSTSIQ